MTWSYSGDMHEFLRMLGLNFVIVGTVTLIRESFRIFFCYREKLKSEYRFWIFGTLLTFISTLLGNTFSLVSYTLTEGESEKKLGKLSFIISLITVFASIAAYVINIFHPSLVLQMIFVYCIIVSFIELFPLAPMAGADIRKWNAFVYVIFYLIVFALYVSMNFTMYV
jgi:hypothetical protein